MIIIKLSNWWRTSLNKRRKIFLKKIKKSTNSYANGKTLKFVKIKNGTLRKEISL